MPGGLLLFEYKCGQGHITEKKYPWRTKYDDHAQIICPECLKTGITTEAFLVFSCPEQGKK